MKIIKWFLSRRYLQKLAKQHQSPFKLKLETDSRRSACISEIQGRIEPLWLSVKALIYKLGIKNIQNNAIRVSRDDYGKQTTLPNPVFSAAQGARIKIKQRLFSIAIPVFLTAESALYLLTAALFVPGASPYLKALVALFLALLFMLSLNYSFEKHFAYREAVDRHSRKELSDFQLRVYRDQRNFGYLLGGLSFTAFIFAGLSRIFFLEHIPANGLDEAKLKSIQVASTWGSLFTMVVTLVTALLMGLLKHEQRKNGVQYRVLQEWQTANVKRNSYTQELIKQANTIILIAEQCA